MCGAVEEATTSVSIHITGLLGRGTQGNVWNAVINSDGRQVAIKCLHKRHLADIHSEDSAKQKMAKHFWNAFHREISILEACLGHPNIVQIICWAPDRSHIFLEKAVSNLRDCLLHCSLSFQKSCRWSRDILCGVGYLHSVGVTHTDVKPENLLIGGEDQIKICDFGSSQRHDKGDISASYYVTGEFSTLWYRAPELLLGSKSFNNKIDVWAIGCIMLEMLSGAVAFQGQLGVQFGIPYPDVTHVNFHSDQLRKVLSMAGTPTPESLAAFACAGCIKDWPPFQRIVEPTVRSVFKMAAYDGAPSDDRRLSAQLWVQVIGGMLTILPWERRSCSDVLNMPLFLASSDDAPDLDEIHPAKRPPRAAAVTNPLHRNEEGYTQQYQARNARTVGKDCRRGAPREDQRLNRSVRRSAESFWMRVMNSCASFSFRRVESATPSSVDASDDLTDETSCARCSCWSSSSSRCANRSMLKEVATAELAINGRISSGVSAAKKQLSNHPSIFDGTQIFHAVGSPRLNCADELAISARPTSKRYLARELV